MDIEDGKHVKRRYSREGPWTSVIISRAVKIRRLFLE